MLDDFTVEVIAFLSDLDGCFSPRCKYVRSQINGMGRQRSYCAKYGQHIKRVHIYCVDRFPGFTKAEVSEIKRQYKAGICELVIKGVTV